MFPWPLLLFLGGALLIVASMLLLSALLGARHRAPALTEPYESGAVPTGAARVRYSAQFYLIAMFFVIFDLEAVYFFAWALVAPEVGWLGYGGMFVFTLILLAALVYEWRIGALDWAPKGRKPGASTEVDP